MGKIIESEELRRLDATLASPTLTEKDNVKRLVQKHLLKYPPTEEDAKDGLQGSYSRDKLLENRSARVWDFLELLRSASGSKHDKCRGHSSSSHGWKVKQEDNRFRVMYREGPKGSPFHTILAEGYIDGSFENSLSVGWETSLYSNWWPQVSIPPFKAKESICLKRISIGEEISLIRMKVPWPLSERELVLHFFQLEHFEDELLIVLNDSVRDQEEIDGGIDVIPTNTGAVRMELMGGFAMQKVSSTQTYFRTIVNLDLKLDFVPAWLINFISRHLFVHGYKLYLKTVHAVAEGDEKFRQCIDNNPMYIRIREGLQDNKETRQKKESQILSSGKMVESKHK